VKIIFRCDPALRDTLPRPTPALQALPEWLREMPGAAFSDLHGREVRTVKQCPPLAGETQPRSPLSFHVSAQVAGTPLAAADGRTLVKFNSFWTVELEPGYSLFATHPVNREDLPFRTLTGIVDSDRFNAVGILFPAAWTDDGFAGVLPAGTPVAQCFPVSREAISLVFEELTPDRIEAHDQVANALHGAPGLYRKAYRDRRPSSDK
jgi:hypothetical protein